MTIFLPNEIANRYTLNSIIYKNDYKKGLRIYMKVDNISFYGFKGNNSKTKFSGQIIKKEPLKLVMDGR